MRKISKNTYLQLCGTVVLVLALYRCYNPDVARRYTPGAEPDTIQTDTMPAGSADTIAQTQAGDDRQVAMAAIQPSKPASADAKNYHPIYSVPRFKDAFPDSQEVHLQGVKRWGVKVVQNRQEAERRKQELVYVGANPYFCLDSRMRSSIPYLVPRASTLLNDIGRVFFDSLYVKGIPLHKPIITSVLRTREDVDRLRLRNGNATENSCHLYGTTFDIAQNRYQTVYDPRKGPRREVQNDTLKWVLSEVLRDMREQGRCYIKYEVKQGCFHITVR